MGKINYDNPYRQKWLKETESWLKRNGYVINPDINEKFTCPRCGSTKIYKKDEINTSQFGYRICPKCYDDEIIRDSLGIEQLETRYWYIFSSKNCSSMGEL
jgi:predicted RNA-binding Zn-ribbon protein involved in translation (DUF1610 family)